MTTPLVGHAKARASVCFISETGEKTHPLLDASVRYRCYHPAEILRSRGVFCEVYAAETFLANPNFNHDVFVFHRPTFNRPKLPAILAQIRRMGGVAIADYDDLNFGGPDLALSSSSVKNGVRDPDVICRGFAANLAALELFNKVSVSTGPLGDRVKSFNPSAQVCVLPNLVPKSVWAMHERWGTAWKERDQGMIGYFSGSRSHDLDFLMAAESIHRVLLEQPQRKFLVVGPLGLPEAFYALPNVIRGGFRPYVTLPSLMSLCGTVIAPSEPTPFNESKSRVKFLEAALSGSHLVASPIPDMAAIGGERLTLANSKTDWYHAVKDLPPHNVRSERIERNLDYIRDHSAIDRFISFVGL